MQRFLSILTAISGLLLALVTYERLVVESAIGPAAIASLAVLLVVFLSLGISRVLYNTRHRATVGKLWLSALSTVVTYLVLDLAAGYVLIERLSPQLVPDRYRHHKMVPNSRSSFRQQDFQYTQRVNNLGLRGDDVAEVKPANTFRVLTLGDSFTMGKGVEDRETFSQLLGRGLQQHVAACSGTTRIDVVNGGVDSYAPILSYIEARELFDRVQPDLIVHSLDVSDLIQEQAYRQIAVYDDRGELVGVPQEQRRTSISDKVGAWVERHMFITRAALFYLIKRSGYRDFSVRAVVEQAGFATAALTLANDSEPRERQWQDIFDSITKIKAFTVARGADYVLATYPWAHQVSDAEWVRGRDNFIPKGAAASDRSRDTIRRMSQSGGIELIDLFPVFRAYRGSQPLYFDVDPHWTTTGHQVMAKGLEDHLVKQYSAEWCGAPGGTGQPAPGKQAAAR
jgi:hypothetical protein